MIGSLEEGVYSAGDVHPRGSVRIPPTALTNAKVKALLLCWCLTYVLPYVTEDVTSLHLTLKMLLPKEGGKTQP